MSVLQRMNQEGQIESFVRIQRSTRYEIQHMVPKSRGCAWCHKAKSLQQFPFRVEKRNTSLPALTAHVQTILGHMSKSHQSPEEFQCPTYCPICSWVQLPMHQSRQNAAAQKLETSKRSFFRVKKHFRSILD